MSDQKPPPPPKKPAALSKESQWIGFVVLGFGVLAVISVLFLLLAQNKAPAPGSPADQQIYQDLAERLEPAETMQQYRHTSSQTAKEKKRTPPKKTGKSSIKLSQIEGVWQAALQDANGVIQIRDGTYRLIIDYDSKVLDRRYSNGTLDIDEQGLLWLRPRREWGPPEKTGYTILTSSDFAVSAVLHRGSLIWQIPETQTSRIHPFLRLAEDQIAFWDIMK